MRYNLTMKKLNGMRIDLAVEVLRRLLPMKEPADAALRRFFQENRTGKSERAFAAEAAFSILRRKTMIDHLIAQSGEQGTPRKMVLAWLARIEGMNLRELHPYLIEQEEKWLASIKAVSLDDAPLEAKADLPEWIVSRLKRYMSSDDILSIGRAMQHKAPMDLRVNTVKAKREEVLAEIGGEATRYSPIGIRFNDKFPLNENPLFLEGKVEVQDEGSQLLGFLLAPRRREMVVDFCAGAGGKTLMLGALMGSTGRLYAFDVSERRLEKLGPRLKRSGLSNVNPQWIQSENDIRVKRLSGKIDRVLVDAPCSGTGTLRRNPDLKWRQSGESLKELAKMQASILAGASVLVKPGGRIVYATCSILQEENQEIVSHFLASHPDFRLLDASEILKGQHIDLGTGQYLELRPDIHGTDGFFASAMERIGA